MLKIQNPKPFFKSLFEILKTNWIKKNFFQSTFYERKVLGSWMLVVSFPHAGQVLSEGMVLPSEIWTHMVQCEPLGRSGSVTANQRPGISEKWPSSSQGSVKSDQLEVRDHRKVINQRSHISEKWPAPTQSLCRVLGSHSRICFLNEGKVLFRVLALAVTLSNLISNIYPETKPYKSHLVFLLLMILWKFRKLIWNGKVVYESLWLFVRLYKV